MQPVSTATVTPTPQPPRLLSICLGQEPESLFLYADQSLAARSVREALYDGPFDLLNFDAQAVILEKRPRLADGDVSLQPIEARAGDWIVDASGNLSALNEGVVYFPSACRQAECAQTYTGNAPVTMDSLVVRFKLKPGLQWSDGTPLSAADSRYSYELAQALYPRYRPDLLNHTLSYQALDEITLEWRGIPGYLDPLYFTNFFTPLPAHLWSAYTPAELLTLDISNRSPLGWGAYIIDEWVQGDHISFHKNPLYFRAAEGLPVFDRLVFRFVSNGQEALTALLAGECDLVDQSALSEQDNLALTELARTNRLLLASQNGSAWEHLDFNVAPADPNRPNFFQNPEVRQALAMCVDRAALAEELFPTQSQTLDTYLPPMHPLYNPQVPRIAYDPSAASARLEALGWLDLDQDARTPRIAQGIPGVPDGTPLRIEYLIADGEVRRLAAEKIKASLEQCGVQTDIVAMQWDQLFAPGSQGPIFGRQFQMAQFGWETSLQPACFLYTTTEIPGPYPQHPKGWGGANATGYSNPEFDQACMAASNLLPDDPAYAAAHHQAQAIFAADLPVIPLYLIPTYVAMRPDMCAVQLDPSAGDALWNLENFNYGEACR